MAHVGVLSDHVLFQNRVPKLSDPGPPLSGMIDGDLEFTFLGQFKLIKVYVF